MVKAVRQKDGAKMQPVKTIARRIRSSRVTILLATCLTPLAAYAQCQTYICSGTIQALTIGESAVYVRLTGDTVGLTACTPYSGSYFTLPKSHSNYESYYAAMLAAYMSKEPLSLRPVDGSPNCSISYIAFP
jgi:hypothetical protein